MIGKFPAVVAVGFLVSGCAGTVASLTRTVDAAGALSAQPLAEFTLAYCLRPEARRVVFRGQYHAMLAAAGWPADAEMPTIVCPTDQPKRAPVPSPAPAQ